MLSSLVFATAKSGLPSPLKSEATIERESEPTPKFAAPAKFTVGSAVGDAVVRYWVEALLKIPLCPLSIAVDNGAESACLIAEVGAI